MQSTQGFHAIMNVILIPIWLLSGAFFPATGVPVWLAWIMYINPLTYGIAALRRCLYLTHSTSPGALPALAPALAVTVLFGAVAFAVAIYTARRSTL
jgi:ABC-type polysaccharide/polyol phosphate export permease